MSKQFAAGLHKRCDIHVYELLTVVNMTLQHLKITKTALKSEQFGFWPGLGLPSQRPT